MENLRCFLLFSQEHCLQMVGISMSMLMYRRAIFLAIFSGGFTFIGENKHVFYLEVRVKNSSCQPILQSFQLPSGNLT